MSDEERQHGVPLTKIKANKWRQFQEFLDLEQKRDPDNPVLSTTGILRNIHICQFYRDCIAYVVGCDILQQDSVAHEEYLMKSKDDLTSVFGEILEQGNESYEEGLEKNRKASQSFCDSDDDDVNNENNDFSLGHVDPIACYHGLLLWIFSYASIGILAICWVSLPVQVHL